ncbi:hypothetical protein OUZ56_019813 [Daphnia magna]|uniref:Uncharacterized protein n=1 Tax=Daphnia magna TaxID=35525 RepID=A0ABQ9ZCP5_9CRUS|nr:hypothetical protein OUZ56_019813 [Daphnia magna]
MGDEGPSWNQNSGRTADEILRFQRHHPPVILSYCPVILFLSDIRNIMHNAPGLHEALRAIVVKTGVLFCKLLATSCKKNAAKMLDSVLELTR